MTNYITQLRKENRDMTFTRANTRAKVEQFRLHLQLDKFKGHEADGSRKDWMATADIERWLSYIMDEEQEIAA